MRALIKRSKHCQYPGCTAIHELQAHHLVAYWRSRKTEIDELVLLCTRHHKLLQTTTSKPAATATTPCSRTYPGAPSPPANHTHRPRDLRV
jgi:hypothetical protein